MHHHNQERHISFFFLNTINSKIMNFILLTVLCVLVHVTYGQNCAKCMTNDAYCLTEKSFYFCMDGNALTATLHTCENDYICTDSENICEPRIQTDGTETVAVCSTSCNKCPDRTANNKRFTCVSKSHYGLCVNGNVTVVSPCEGNTLCNSNIYEATGKICASQCVIDFFGYSNTCSNDDTTTSTTIAPSTTPNVQNLKDQCRDSQIINQPFFYRSNENDADCKTYIYCEPFGGEMEALLIKCSSGYYFDSTTSQCVNTKPANCGINPTTTTTTITPPTTIIPPATTTIPPALTTSIPPATTTTTITPATTTIPPATTTTTIPPASTTISISIPPATTTTIPPATTTTTIPPASAAISTSIPPATTTIPPATTTIPPATTTIPPATTTIPPATTTIPPATTTSPPATTNN